MQPVPMRVDELVAGTICGGSDGTSGMTANPAMGRAFDLLVARNAACIFYLPAFSVSQQSAAH